MWRCRSQAATAGSARDATRSEATIHEITLLTPATANARATASRRARWVRCGRSTAGERRDARFGGGAPEAVGPGCTAARWVVAAVAGAGAGGLRRHQGVL